MKYTDVMVSLQNNKAFTDKVAEAKSALLTLSAYTGDSEVEKTSLQSKVSEAENAVQNLLDEVYLSSLGENKGSGWLKDPYRPVFTQEYKAKGNSYSVKWVETLYPLSELLDFDALKPYLKDARNAVASYGLRWCGDSEENIAEMLGCEPDENVEAMGAAKAEFRLQTLVDYITNGEKGNKITIKVARNMLVKGSVIRTNKYGKDKVANLKRFANTIGHYICK